MVSPVLIQAGIPVLIGVLSEALSRMEHPAARVASKSLGNVNDAYHRGQITPEQIAEANRHAETIASLQAQETRAAFEQVNESLRAEISSEDVYVRRMRPTFGYLMAGTWAMQMTGIAYIVVFRTEQAHGVLAAMDSLAAIWAMGLSVMGIYFYKRSEEKRGYAANAPLSFPLASLGAGGGHPAAQADERTVDPVPVPKPALRPGQGRLNN